MVGGGCGIGVGLRHGPLGGLVDLLVDLVAHLVNLVLRHHTGIGEGRFHARNRVDLAIGFQLVGRAVLAVVVGRGVRKEAHHIGHKANRPAPSADVAEGRPGGRRGGKEVGPVHAHPAESFVARRELIRRSAGRLLVDGHANRVLVILHDEQGRRLLTGRPVEGLVEVPLRGGTVAAGDVDVIVFAALLDGEAEAEARVELGPDGRGRGHDVEAPEAEVFGHLPTAGVGIVGLGQMRQEGLPRGHAQRERRTEVAIIEAEPVVAGPFAGPGVAANGGLDGFVPRTADVEMALALLQQRQHLLVEPPREHHHAEALPEVVRIEISRREPINLNRPVRN